MINRKFMMISFKYEILDVPETEMFSVFPGIHGETDIERGYKVKNT